MFPKMIQVNKVTVTPPSQKQQQQQQKQLQAPPKQLNHEIETISHIPQQKDRKKNLSFLPGEEGYGTSSPSCADLDMAEPLRGGVFLILDACFRKGCHIHCVWLPWKRKTGLMVLISMVLLGGAYYITSQRQGGHPVSSSISHFSGVTPLRSSSSSVPWVNPVSRKNQPSSSSSSSSSSWSPNQSTASQKVGRAAINNDDDDDDGDDDLVWEELSLDDLKHMADDDDDDDDDPRNIWNGNSPPVRLNDSQTLESLIQQMRAPKTTTTSTLSSRQTTLTNSHNNNKNNNNNNNNKIYVASASQDEDKTGAASSKKKKFGQQYTRYQPKEVTKINEPSPRQKSKSKSSSQKPQPDWPVIRYEDNDEELKSTMTNIGPMHAADSLLCRESVINFVINATDLKDECDGLKKAFDKTCSNDGEVGTDNKNNNNNRRRRRQRRERRKLTFWHQRITTLSAARRIQVFCWEHYRWWYKMAESVLLWRGGRSEFFFAEDMVVESYPDAARLVELDLDPWMRQDLRDRWSLEKQRQRMQRRLKKKDFEEDKEMDEMEDSETATTPTVDEEEGADAVVPTTSNTKNVTEKKPSKSIALPTSSQHVSDKVLSETWLLHQGDKLIQKVQNQTAANAEAIQDAQKSSKAMAYTNAAVSAVLNDPTSIEARKCCASILNVYHENCSTDEEETLSDSRLFFVVFVILLCGMVKSLIRYFKILWLPEAAGCILVGGTFL